MWVYRLSRTLHWHPDAVLDLSPDHFFSFVALAEIDGPWWVKDELYAARTCQVVAAAMAGHKSHVRDWLFDWSNSPQPEVSFSDAFDAFKAAFGA